MRTCADGVQFSMGKDRIMTQKKNYVLI